MLHFSNRLNWRTEKNRISELIEQKRHDGVAFVDLTESNPTRVGLTYPEQLILDGVSENGCFTYTPDARGNIGVREAIANYYHDHGADILTDQIIVTASTSEAYTHLFRLLANPGDNVLVPQPSYPLFEYLAGLESIGTQSYPLDYDDRWRIDRRLVTDGITAETKAILAVNPNNPTGSYLSDDDYEGLVDICSERGLALIIDEVFLDYPMTAQSDSVQTRCGEERIVSFVLSGASKIAALPQLKVSWIVVNGPESERRRISECLEVINDLFLSASGPSQSAARVAIATRNLVQKQIVDRCKLNLGVIQDCLRSTEAEVFPVEGGWYSVLSVPAIRSDEEWVMDLLEKKNVLIHPGYFFDFPDETKLVLSLLLRPDLLEQGMSCLRALIEES